MAGTLKHAKTSGKAAPTDTTKVGGPDWDADHNFAGGALGSLLYRDTGATDGANWLADVAVGSVLVSGGVGAAPAWSATPTLTDLTLTGKLKASDGVVGAPAVAFTSSASTGMFYGTILGGPSIHFAANGIWIASVTGNSDGIKIRPSNPLSWGSGAETAAADTYLYRDAANTLALRNSTTAQTFRIYNTFTDASNYERLNIEASASATKIYTGKAGTGSNRALQLGNNGATQWQINFNGSTDGHLLAITDNAVDIGASGAARPRNIFVGSSFVNKTKAGTPTDSDVTNPADGMLVVDTTASKIWVRTGGAWKSVAVA